MDDKRMLQVPDRRHWKQRAREFISLIQDTNEASSLEDLIAIKLELIFREGIQYGLSELQEVLKR